MATVKTQGRRSRENALSGQHFIQLWAEDGHLNLASFLPRDIRTSNGRIFGRAEIFGQMYRVGMMQRVAAWRICDEAGNWRSDVRFSELNGAFEQSGASQLAAELNSAGPHSWEAIDERRGASERSASRRRTEIRRTRTGGANGR